MACYSSWCLSGIRVPVTERTSVLKSLVYDRCDVFFQQKLLDCSLGFGAGVGRFHVSALRLSRVHILLGDDCCLVLELTRSSLQGCP